MSRMVYHDDDRCRMVFEFYRGRVYLHLAVRKWGPSVYRLMRAEWPRVVSTLRAAGYERIHAFYEASNQRMAAFAGRFGFRELRRNADFVLMERCDG